MSNHHPLLDELLGVCRSHGLEESKAYLTLQAYLELCEVRKFWSVKHQFDENLQLFYLTAKKEKDDSDYDVYVPVDISETITIEKIENIQNSLSLVNKQINLIISDRDSSSAYYKLTEGLVRPDSPETMQCKKEKESKRNYVEVELNRNKKILYAKALRNESEEKT